MIATRRTILASATALALGNGSRARAQKTGIKVGVLADFSGVYTDVLGPNGVACARQAVVDFRPDDHGFGVEVVFADHQNKADLGSAIARSWYDAEGVDAIIGLPNSSVALAVAQIARERDKAAIATAVASLEFTGAQCTPNTINWTYDAYMLSKATATSIVGAGGKRWYFVTTDNAFGNALQQETAGFVKEAGGTVLGNAKIPLGSTDYSSHLLTAQASGADTLGLSLGGIDIVNCLKQADEFGLRQTMRMAALLMLLSDIHVLGLPQAQGLLHTSSFYWDKNERTRAFTRRVLPKLQGAYPGMIHAGCYGATLHYLRAVADLGVAEAKRSGAAAIARMKAMPTDDDAFGPASVRADGRVLLPAYLLKVKEPSESKGPWDYCTVGAEIAAVDAAKPLAQGGCPLVKA